MILLLTIISTILAAAAAQNRVIEITTTNVQLVLRTVDRLHLLLHDPTCPYSRDYAQKFLEVKTPLQMGIADCQREKELCSHLNVTSFPALVQLTTNTMNILDEQQFLMGQGLVEENDPKVVLNGIVGRLKGESGWAAVVLEQQGLPVLQKVEKGEGVFYVSPPSRLYSHLWAMVGRKMGCWILSSKEGQLKKYYCGNGYKEQELLKYLQNFRRGKLVSHTFTRQTNNTQMSQNQLAQIIASNYALKKCRLVYFHSRHCEHCSLTDVSQIQNVLASLKLRKDFQVQVYDLDFEELPSSFNLRRLPELVQFCNFQKEEFGDIFTIERLKRFLGRTRSPQRVQSAQRAQRGERGQGGQVQGVASGERQQTVADERLEL